MSGWVKENGPDGLLVWRGKDSVYNVFHERARHMNRNAWAGIAIGAFMAVVGFGLVGGDSAAAKLMSLIFGTVGLFGLATAVLCFSVQSWRNIEWGGNSWALKAKADRLEYLGAPAWAEILDSIARVETSNTKAFTPSRDYSALFPINKWVFKPIEAVPDHEWQVFLFMADGTRRVIYTANAARDDCAALAASIRGWLESARAAGPVASPSQPSPARPVADGFDL